MNVHMKYKIQRDADNMQYGIECNRIAGFTHWWFVSWFGMILEEAKKTPTSQSSLSLAFFSSSSRSPVTNGIYIENV